ncbi:MAG: bifunctional demethylmenaquinone methyltransferase/2-methoxy-6-polyprenyl-1,4-benzoquinol methylase UbiE [Muribaculaceae bacterium]|nr:bifunctional demethylmenaquinone methyltransferase/2-methoxy-6-polyprenyl-1,4-benzoquinol methylase UbiE [Muribaculaceae bacterium]
MNCEKINPYAGDTRPKSEQVRDMFDNIAPAYDFMNRAMTFGIDRIWRRKAVDMLPSDADSILDIATGTGDLALLMARRTQAAHITGVDLSEGMIEIGRRKVHEAGMDSRIDFQVADCLSLPFADNSFRCVTAAYGVRNFENLEAGYREMLRVLRPGGMAMIIELSTPRSAIVSPLYRLYTRTLIPAIGRLVSHDVRAYSYLPESIAAVAQGEEMTALMRRAGFVRAEYRPLTFGTCTIYTAYK